VLTRGARRVWDRVAAVWARVTIRCGDRAASERFYDLVLAAVGPTRTSIGDARSEWGEFAVVQATDDAPTTRGLHIGFRAESRERVDAFWRAGIDAGYRDDGAPGPRPQYTPTYYGGFLLDPDGNSAEAVHHARMREQGVVDHLWIRVADLAAAQDFYLAAAQRTGFELAVDTPALARFRAPPGGSFTVLSDERPVTEHLHMAFGAGEVLRDPDGNDVEVDPD
jgi:catechol 2,3-dioxygenase-like lactoylglutathione lyase family enzyme